MPSSFSISPHFKLFFRDLVSTGRYNKASEVVRARLRLFEDCTTCREIILDKSPSTTSKKNCSILVCNICNGNIIGRFCIIIFTFYKFICS